MMVLRLGMISLMVGLALAGCGRQGSLEPPKAAAEPTISTNDPGAVAPVVQRAAPEKPFVLDGLI